jgi:CubicO group peptidase (beta-lactamase class C family)
MIRGSIRSACVGKEAMLKMRKLLTLQKLRILLLVSLTIFFLSLLIASVAFSPGLVLRAITWGAADVYEYLKFPGRTLTRAETVFHFIEANEEAKVRALLEDDPRISDLEEFLESTKTQAFIVIQNDRILYERYFNGMQRDSIVTSFSVAKSFDSALIGIAIQEGWIGSVNDPITDYIPELLDRDPQFSRITIRDLLLMSSGLRYVERLPYGDDVRTYIHPDLRSQALTKTEIIDPPGVRFLYNNYNPLLLGIILERTTGMPVAEFLQEHLWTPLGMEFDGSWSLDSKEHGFEKMESGINARAIDFAKFGRLYLNQGWWNGAQIVPESWVQDSTAPETAVRDEGYYADDYGQHIFKAAEGGYYKYMWYGLLREGRPNDFFAFGAKGQFIYVSPSKQLIIVRHGEETEIEGMDWIEIFYHFASKIEEA